MKKALLLLLLTLRTLAFAQTPEDIIEAVYKAQRNLKQIVYSVTRTDSLLTGDIRTMTGGVIIVPAPTDSVFGFKFNAQLQGTTNILIYDGHIGYNMDTLRKTYSTQASPNAIKYMLNGGAGWLILPDLVKLDTARAISADLSQTAAQYLLTLKYADYLPENVINRYKLITIDKASRLPIAVRQHSETNGRTQDLYWHINKIDSLNNTRDPFGVDHLKDYQHELLTQASLPAVFTLKGVLAPEFKLDSFSGDKVSLASSSYKGKVVLLDFWEVWCGPCITGLPKVQQIFDRYKQAGLRVLGITNDIKQLEPAKKLVSDKKYSFKMLSGNPQLKKDYKLDGTVPLYILVNKKGRIAFIGGLDHIEQEVVNALKE